MTSQTCEVSGVPWAIRNLNPLEVYAINYIDVKMIGTMVKVANHEKENRL
jgi:hypothetical protein